MRSRAGEVSDRRRGSHRHPRPTATPPRRPRPPCRRRTPRRSRAPSPPAPGPRPVSAAGAVHVMTTSNSSARNALEHRPGVAQRADDEQPSSDRVEVLGEHRRARVGAGRVVRSVDDHQRLVGDDLEAARQRHVGEALRHDLGRERGGEERLDGGRARSRRCRPGRRRASARTPRGRSSSACGCRRAGRRGPVGWSTWRSRCRAAARRRRLGGHTATNAGSVSPITAALAGLMMPAFSRRCRPASGRRIVVVDADVGDDGDLGVDDVGGVPATEQPDLDARRRRRRRRRTSAGPPR